MAMSAAHGGGMLPTKPGAQMFWVSGAPDARNASMTAVGVNQNVTSARARDIDYDDVEVPKNIKTSEARENLRMKIQESTFILVPGGRETYIGTPHTHDSIYPELVSSGAALLKIPLFENSVRYEKTDTALRYKVPFTPGDDGLYVFAGIHKFARLLTEGEWQAGVGAWASTLASSLSSRVIMIPARYEKSLARKVVKELPDNRQAVWAMKNISDVVSTFARLSLLITERAGLAHLAGALGTPALLIGQVRPEERPLAGNIAVVPSHTDSRTILEQASLLIMASRAEYLRSR